LIVLADTDILSAFAKVNAMKLIKKLFEELKISPSIYEELMRAKRAGYSFVDNIFQNTEIILLSEMEFNSFRNLLENEKNMHEGECQLIALCRSRNGFLLTNDRYVKNYCKENGIEFLDMEEILRAMKLKKILNHEELRKLIEDIEKKDHTIIKSKDDILES
jgi:predicted nucleic acid-binding protein